MKMPNFSTFFKTSCKINASILCIKFDNVARLVFALFKVIGKRSLETVILNLLPE